MDVNSNERRRQTRSNVYHYLYGAQEFCTRQSLAQALDLSLPTIYQNLTDLVDAGLVRYAGQSQSTGGRKASGLAIVPDARVAVGIALTEDRLRFSAADLGPRAQEGALSCKGLTRQLLHVPQSTLDDLPLDHGGIVTVDGEKAGVYKNPQGVCYVVNPRCPHLGCQLEWNPDEKSWDCPCHGSRFDYKGNLIDNPAQEDLCHD